MKKKNRNVTNVLGVFDQKQTDFHPNYKSILKWYDPLLVGVILTAKIVGPKFVIQGYNSSARNA